MTDAFASAGEPHREPGPPDQGATFRAPASLWPPADPEIEAALRAAFRDGSWGQYDGPNSQRLTTLLATQFQAAFVHLCCSGTIGVELALRGCGVVAGDEVILAGYDFPGNFRAIEALGARPVLVDIDPDRWSLNIGQLEAAASDRVTAVLVSHLHGASSPMPLMMETARARGWKVVEDACQQPGAQVAGRPAGAWGDAAVLSFGGSKLLTAGRGGAVLTSDPTISQRIKVFSERGNRAFPLSELQAAVLAPQLDRLEQRNHDRAAAIGAVREITAGVPAEVLRPIRVDRLEYAAFYKHAWSFVPAEKSAVAREQLLAILANAGAPYGAGFRGFANRSSKRCRQVGELEWSRRFSQSTVLLHHAVLLATEQDSKKTTAAQQAATMLVRAIERVGC